VVCVANNSTAAGAIIRGYSMTSQKHQASTLSQLHLSFYHPLHLDHTTSLNFYKDTAIVLQANKVLTKDLAETDKPIIHYSLSAIMADKDERQNPASPEKDQKVAEYIAPYESCPESTTPWRYYVIFRPEHTPEEHAKAIGEKEIALFAPNSIGPCSGTMTDEYRERVRRDPGVEKVFQYSGEGEWF